MSDSKFVAMLVIFLIAFFVMLTGTLGEASVMAALLAWGLYNDYRYGRIEKRFIKYKKAYEDMVSELIKESDEHDDRHNYKVDKRGTQHEPEAAVGTHRIIINGNILHRDGQEDPDHDDRQENRQSA